MPHCVIFLYELSSFQSDRYRCISAGSNSPERSERATWIALGTTGLFGNSMRFAAGPERWVDRSCASVTANTLDADLASETSHSAVVA
jgi:hypothetical protein